MSQTECFWCITIALDGFKGFFSTYGYKRVIEAQSTSQIKLKPDLLWTDKTQSKPEF